MCNLSQFHAPPVGRRQLVCSSPACRDPDAHVAYPERCEVGVAGVPMWRVRTAVSRP